MNTIEEKLVKNNREFAYHPTPYVLARLCEGSYKINSIG
jgi:hypothetical protein